MNTHNFDCVSRDGERRDREETERGERRERAIGERGRETKSVKRAREKEIGRAHV